MKLFLRAGTSQLAVKFKPDLSFHPCMVSHALDRCRKRNSFYLVRDKPCLKDLAVLSFYLATLSEPLLWATLSYHRPPVTTHFVSADAVKRAKAELRWI